MKKKKLKLIATVVTVVLSASMIGGCTNSNSKLNDEKTKETSAATNVKRTIVDSTGEKIELPEKLEKMAILPWPWVSIIYTLEGSGNNIIAMPKGAKDGYDMSILKNMAPELDDVSTDFVDNDGNVNMETMANLKPDAAFCFTGKEAQTEKFKSLGIPVVQVKSAKDMKGLKDIIKITGEALGKEDRSKKLLEWYDKTEKYIESKQSKLENVEKYKVLNFYTTNDMKMYSKSSFNATINDMLGGQSINTTTNAGTAKVSMEEVLNYNPDIILISNFDDVVPDDFYNNKLPGQDWSKVSAVVNHKVYKVPCGIYRMEPPNSVEKPIYMLWLASILHPDIFSDVNIEKEISNFLKEFFDYNATQDDIDKVLHKKLYH